jgi:hypothetical protein
LAGIKGLLGRSLVRRRLSAGISLFEIEANGGESYLDLVLESASCRLFIARRAIFAIRPSDHCTLLHDCTLDRAAPVTTAGSLRSNSGCTNARRANNSRMARRHAPSTLPAECRSSYHGGGSKRPLNFSTAPGAYRFRGQPPPGGET